MGEDGIIIFVESKNIYLSSDSGLNWKIETSGIDTSIDLFGDIYVVNIVIDSKGFIYLYGPNGLYKSTTGLNGLNIKNLNAITSSYQSLNIYNINGKKVSTLSGKNTHWDGRGDLRKILPNGIYFLTTKNEMGKIETSKIVLNR